MTDNCAQWLGLEEAATAMQTTKVHLLMMVKRGLVKAREVDGEWRVDPASITGKQRSGDVFNHARCKSHDGCGGCS